MTDVLETPPRETGVEAGAGEGVDLQPDASPSPIDYAARRRPACGGPARGAAPLVAERVQPLAGPARAHGRGGGRLHGVRAGQHPRQPGAGDQHPDRGRLRLPRVGTGLPARPHPPALAAVRLGAGLVRRLPHVQVLHGGAGAADGAAGRRGALRRRPQDGQRAGPGRPAAVLLGLRPHGRACRSRSRRCARSPPTFFLFDWSFTIYGGNVASTMAGEFSFSIALCVAMLYLGVLARGMRTGKGRALAASLFALTILCHLIVGIFATVATLLDVPAVGRPQAHPLRPDHGAGGRPAHRVLDPAVPVRRALHDRHDLRAAPGGQRPQRPARLVLADALPVRGLDRPDGLRPGRHRPDRVRDPGPARRRLPRAGGRGVRDVGLRLAAEPPVERPAPAVHVPGPVHAGLHRGLRAGGPRPAPRPPRAARRRGADVVGGEASALGPAGGRAGHAHRAVGPRVDRPRRRGPRLARLRRHPLPAGAALRQLRRARREDHATTGSSSAAPSPPSSTTGPSGTTPATRARTPTASTARS